MSFDADRVLADLYALREFGRDGTGVHRPTYSEVDMQARRWFAARCEEAGLDARIDGIGNVFGRSRNPGRALLAGSHLESQNHAGWLDGALGAIYGLEAARAHPMLPVDVVGWADEEGHFFNFTGSRSYIGLLDDAEIDRVANRYHGQPLRDALAEAGLAGTKRDTIDPARLRGYLEAHIEQGDVLESTGEKIGVVTSIVAIWQYRITIRGAQNHAGTTRMAIRRDAGAAAARIAVAIAARFPEAAGPRSVWTVGRIALDPGAASIIPGGAEMLFQFRDDDRATLERLQALLREIVADEDRDGPCDVRLDTVSQSEPSLMDASLMAALDAAAERAAPGKHRRMPSGAGHDAQYLARVVPSAMLFVPSIGGISHHVSENTSDADIALGARVFCDAVGELLRQA